MKKIYGEKIKGYVIIAACVAAVAIALAVIGYFVYALHLCTSYKNDCKTLNQAIVGSPDTLQTVARGTDKPLKITDQDLNYYASFLLDRQTVVAGRGGFEENEKTIVITLSGARFSLSDAGTDRETSTVGVHITIGDRDLSYRVLTKTTWMQLSAWYTNFRYRADHP